MLLAGPVLLLAHLSALVTADTEIVNFRNGQTLSHAPVVQEFSSVLLSMMPSKTVSRFQVPSLHLPGLQLSFQLLPRKPKEVQFQ